MDVKGMQVTFRTDASIQIGTGHVMRCLALADALGESDAQCSFISRPYQGHLMDLVRQRGHQAIAMPPVEHDLRIPDCSPAHAGWLRAPWEIDVDQTRLAMGEHAVDWLVVDHYAIDRRWEQTIRPHCHGLMVIDDLADRAHDCDLLLDQNLGRSAQDYHGLVSTATEVIIGPEYALLRPDFSKWREYSLARRVNPRLESLLISMGGVDKGNATGEVLDSLQSCELPPDLCMTVIMGPHAPWLDKVREQSARMPWTTQVLAGVNNMAQLMANSDLAIGAAGSTAWERCCLGLPAIQYVLADNQASSAKALAKFKAAFSVENSKLLQDTLQKITPEQLRHMSTSAASLCSGQGAVNITHRMYKSCLAGSVTHDSFQYPR